MGEKMTSTFLGGLIICVLAGSFQYGWNVSNVNGPAGFIKEKLYPNLCVDKCLSDADSLEETNPLYGKQCNSTVLEDESCTVEEYTGFVKNQENQFSTAVSMFTVGGMAGSFSTTFMVTRFGRKGAQFVNCFASFIGGAFYVAAYYLSSHYCLLLARLAVGYFAGLATGICPMYVIEISTADFRGKAGVLPQLFITIGILTAQILAFPSILGKASLWGWFMALGSIPCIVWILYSPKMVESPRYTLIEKNNSEQAQEDLQKLRGVEDVSGELAELEEEAAKLKEMLSFKWQLMIVCIAQMGQQLSGINAIFFYTNDIFKAAGFSVETSTMISALVGLENVGMTFVSLAVIEKFGRTGLHVGGNVLMVIFCLGMFLCLKYLTAASFVPYLSIVCILGYIVGFALGPGPVPWIWNSEYFPQRARGPAGSVSCALNWTAAFVVGKFFPIGTVSFI
ncbi:Oidioi.mRNA.OKI2018_I69.chr1.g2567.t1.cds [Oikopleura dioica]|uniref:Oidioi.mRNA.OKI2018_I69.chr1.g2567.t1.cds n=1 Tax=Oikopleura dioica TaxID=34765 RepID=A0ABN7SVU0_OIKDI|nr:Oidioi.mRNA.OKI2018_I69.chr1.g2567.t1.cds [Oikopleura dioica]